MNTQVAKGHGLNLSKFSEILKAPKPAPSPVDTPKLD